MKVLIVKTSSLGDVVHTLPALTDASAALPGIRFDWVVEESFAEIPAWHPAVDRVIPVALRRWRKTPLHSLRSPEWQRFREALNARPYDAVIDAQGLFKSAILTLLAQGPRYGQDFASAREPLAALAYQHRIPVPRQQHAVERTRQLFAASLGYTLPAGTGHCGIDRSRFQAPEGPPYLVFLHGTTRHDKHWPEPYWRTLIETATAAGFEVKLPWGNEAEHQRAERLAAGVAGASVLPRLNLAGVAGILAGAHAAVAVDTGLGHLSAALSLPCVSLYGPTSPALVGAYGAGQIHLMASDYPLPAGVQPVDPAVFAPLVPALVWQALQHLPGF